MFAGNVVRTSKGTHHMNSSDHEDPDGFINALNFMGWLTGTFRIQKERDPKPLIKGDFAVPDWAVVPIVVLAVLAIVRFFF